MRGDTGGVTTTPQVRPTSLLSGSGRATTAPRTDAHEPAPVVDQLADSVDWFEGTLRSWRRRSWCRAVAVLAVLGAVGDAVTTSMLPFVDGIREGNPVSAAGQALLGSVPVFMFAVTIPLAVVFLVLANRPRSTFTWFIWCAVAAVGAVKVAVTCSNLVVLWTVSAR
ncbi:hypothetical protein [Cellulomonas sp. URHE0023]|uniref:hypothetical protein n=1 Tax=Cellulomonas sp. URHE0023 TaxID=1380354 RepID=UPI0004804EBA|nr:hypothetical protein [Cellulomonas sp. URHE0023]